MIGSGLSLEQAPPFAAPFRFFITAPLFGMLAGLVLLLSDATLLDNRHSGSFLGVVHLVTIGLVTMVMMGAMQQMLPVIAGAQFRNPLANARILHAGLSGGALLFFWGFYFADPGVLGVAVGLLAAVILFFIGIVAVALKNVAQRSDSVRAFGYAVASLGIAVGLGAWVGMAYSGLGGYSGSLAALHIAWIFFGWIVLLVIGVSFQVVPMFYVTEAYPAFCRTQGVRLIFAALVGMSLAAFFGETVTVAVMQGVVVLLVAGFGVVTIVRLKKRKRAVRDANVAFWYLAMSSLVAGSLLWFGGNMAGSEGVRLGASVLLGIGFVLSLISAMLYKIVPFLIWFHLTSQGHFGVPTMRELIGDLRVRLHLYLHVATLLLFLGGALADPLWYTAAGGGLFFSNMLLFFNLFGAGRIYFAMSKKTPLSMTWGQGN